MKKRMVKLSVITAIGLATFVPPVTALATVEDDIEQTEQKINQLESKEQEAINELASITEKISENEANASKLVEEIEKTKATLQQLEEEITVLNDAIAGREERLKEQARSVQLNGNTQSYLEFILKAESLTDVLGRLDVVSQLVSANQELIEAQIADKEAVAQKQEETEETVAEQTLLAADLEVAKAELEEQKVQKESVVASIAAEKAEAQEDKEKYLAVQARAQEELELLEQARAAASETAPVTESTDTSSTTSTNSTTSTEEQTQTVQTSTSTTEQSTTATSTLSSTTSGGDLWSTIQGTAYGVQGTPYQYGGTTTAGFDCSGFTSYVFKAAGISLPRTASGQYAATTKISQSEARPGDLVFFNQTGTIDHVGIYLGNGKFIGSQSSTGVAVAEINQYYWAKYLVGFGRVN